MDKNYACLVKLFAMQVAVMALIIRAEDDIYRQISAAKGSKDDRKRMGKNIKHSSIVVYQIAF